MENNTSARENHGDNEQSLTAVGFLVTIMVFSLSLNLFVCIAITCFHKLRSECNVFVANLCLSNFLLSLLTIPRWIWYRWDKIGFLKILREYPKLMGAWTIVDIFCGTLSILSLAAISVDKYITITRPLRYKADMTTTRNIYILFLLWIYSVVVASTYWAHKALESWEWRIVLHFVIFFCFVIPLIIIVFAYGKIYVIAKLHAEMVNKQAGRKKAREIKAAKTIGIVVGTFFVCWAPFFILNILYTYKIRISYFVVDASRWLTFLNAFLSPFIYTFMDRRFRAVFLDKTLCRTQNSSVIIASAKDYSSDGVFTEQRDKPGHKESLQTSATQC